MSRSSKNHRRDRKKKGMAARADRHRLYEQAVQAVDADYDFLDATFKKLRGRRAHLLREDFCGTAAMCCEWVRHRKGNYAIGVDIDKEVLRWGKKHNQGKLKESAAKRVKLIRSDVRSVDTGPVDIVLAMNFSYQMFKERSALLDYFRCVRKTLVDDGVLFIDAFGGYDAYREIQEPRDCDGFTYIWDQASYNPITGEMTCHIHFSFPDGTRMKRAFSYTWRLWTLPEIREILDEAGFSKVLVYWEGTDRKTGEGNSIYKPSMKGDADPGWICYLSAAK
ncbi:MAG TPA: SAM-dependent methyltransferase [Gammaproteobacteria bacterium]|nr:SAM-dependent methyltransferase [Gammaproteobacteria bacterium]